MNEQPKNFKWSWTVDQRAIVESGLNIDIIDFSILQMLIDFSSATGCKKMNEEGTLFYMFRWKLVKEQFPAMKLNTRQSVKKRMDKLINAKLIAPHPDNQKTRSSWFRFAENRDSLFSRKCKPKLPSVNESLPKDEKTSKPKLPSVNESYPTGKRKLPNTDNESLHDNTTINNKDNNKDIYTPLPKIGDIETKIPEIWPVDLKKSVIEFLEYRQSLPKGDWIKSQKGWEGKITQFSNMLKKHGEKNLIGAINLTIASEWKGVKMSYYFNHMKEEEQINPNGAQATQQPDNYKLSDNLENLYKDSISKYNKKEVSSRISYFNKQEFEMWMPNGKYFEMYRDRQYLAKDIYKKITDTINLLNTSSFFKNHRGQLNDFVIGVFKGQIKVLA